MRMVASPNVSILSRVESRLGKQGKVAALAPGWWRRVTFLVSSTSTPASMPHAEVKGQPLLSALGRDPRIPLSLLVGDCRRGRLLPLTLLNRFHSFSRRHDIRDIPVRPQGRTRGGRWGDARPRCAATSCRCPPALPGRAPAINGQPKRGLGHEHVAALWLKRFAGRIWRQFVVTGYHPHLSPAFQAHPARIPQDMTGWMKRNAHIAHVQCRPIGDPFDCRFRYAPAQQGFRCFRGQITARARPCVVCVDVREFRWTSSSSDSAPHRGHVDLPGTGGDCCCRKGGFRSP